VGLHRRNYRQVRPWGLAILASYRRESLSEEGLALSHPIRATRWFCARTTELQRLEQLPWPRNPFGESASIAELTAELAHASEKADAACSCGCRKEHKQNVSQRLRNPYGRGFDLIYFRAEDCKYKWNRERRRRTGQ
jgi:hypothetical protein